MKGLNKHSTVDDFSKYPLDISLIYALSLGIDKKILSKFNIKSPNATNSYPYSRDWIYWYFLLNSSNNNVFNKSINNSFGNATGSSSSSFSGGGGGGAGGGGAGGF